MVSLSPVDRDIVRRARALRGLRVAGAAFALAAGLTVALAVAARAAGLPIGSPLAIGSALFLALAPLCGYALGWAHAPDVPRLLLLIDLALATGERLCSLYELRLRGGSLALQTRIERELLERPPAWWRVVRVRWTDVVPWAAGCVALAFAVLLLFALPPQSVAIAQDASERARAASLGDDRPASPDDASEASSVVAWEGPGPTEPRTNSPEGLAEILASPPVRGVLGGLANEEEWTAGGSAPEADWRGAVSDFVSELAKRLRDQSEGAWSLSEDERTALRDLLDSVSDPSMHEALSSLLDAASPGGMEEKLSEVERLLKDLDSPADSENGTWDRRAPARADAAPSGSEVVMPEGSSVGGYLGTEVGRLAEDGQTGGAPIDDRPSEGAHGESGEKLVLPQDDETESDLGAEGEPIAAELEGAAPRHRVDTAYRSGSEVGGTRVGDRVPAENRTPPSGAGFTPQEILADWGDEGEVRRFLTRGAPFEPSPQGQGAAPALSVDYNTLRALLEARALAPEAQSLVRAYFERITQGGT